MRHPTILGRSSRGFSLIELMVALVLGILIIGAVIAVFLSNQQTARTKQELDRAQEAFRFASHVIIRVVQQGEIQQPQNAQELVVMVSPGPGHRDCFGFLVENPANPVLHTLNTFFIDGDRLRCRVVSVRQNVADNTTFVDTLVEGLDADGTEFTFGVASGLVGFWSNNSEWQPSPSVPVNQWHNVRSVRVKLSMQSDGEAIGPSARFSATMRCGALDIC